MKKTIAFVLAAVMLFSVVGCAPASSANVDLQAIKTQILSDCGITDPIDLSADKLLSLYGIAQADMAQSACFLVTSAIFPAEILMIEAVDDDAAAIVAEKLQNRLDSLKVQSQSYDADSYAIAQACSVLQNGKYVAMFFSEHGKQMETIYHSYF